jgi:hypothetical protein
MYLNLTKEKYIRSAVNLELNAIERFKPEVKIQGKKPIKLGGSTKAAIIKAGKYGFSPAS